MEFVSKCVKISFCSCVISFLNSVVSVNSFAFAFQIKTPMKHSQISSTTLIVFYRVSVRYF